MLLSSLHLLAAFAAYYHLFTGGWLQTHYTLQDANIVNLFLAVFEVVALLSVLFFWLTRTRAAYRALFWMFMVQALAALCAIAFFIAFALMWQSSGRLI